MKKIISAFSVLISAVCLAANPDPSAWYTPSKEDYAPPRNLKGLMSVTDAKGKIQEVNYDIIIDENGQVVTSTLKDALGDLKLSVQSAIDLITAAILDVSQNALDINLLFSQFTALGKNLTKVFQVDGMKINVGGKTYSLKISQGALKDAISTGTSVDYIDQDGLFFVADDKTLATTTINGSRVIRWKNTPTKEPSVAFASTNGEIMWIPLKDFPVDVAFDETSISTNKDEKLQIKGWHEQSACGAKLTDMLTNKDSLDRGTHTILTRVQVDGKEEPELHYLPIGDILPTNVATQVQTDEKSINKEDGALEIKGWNANGEAPKEINRTTLGTMLSTNTLSRIHLLARDSSGNTSYVDPGKIKTLEVDKKSIEENDGIISLPGVGDARDGQVLTKNGDTVAWKNATAEGDLVSITTNAQNKLSVYGFDAAESNALPYKTNQGKVEWMHGTGLIHLNGADAPSAINLEAGYGMKVEKTDGTILLSSTLNTPDTAGAFSQITFISNIWYDPTSHQLKVTKTTVSARILNDATSVTETVFTATPHSEEHL
jgi:hypothetical protein